MEEPDGGKLLVRIWRGAGVGNLPAYSTTAFSTDCVRPPHAPLLPPCPLMPAPGVGPHAPRRRLARAGCRQQAAGAHRSARTGRGPGDGQPARLELLGGRLLGVLLRAHFLSDDLRRRGAEALRGGGGPQARSTVDAVSRVA